MTKEAYDIARAFRDGKHCNRKRTWTTGEEVYLHGHRIAWRNQDDGVIYMSLCGWGTVTTRDRLNAICDVFGIGRMFRQHKFEQFYGDLPISNLDTVPMCGPLTMQALLADRGLLKAA